MKKNDIICCTRATLNKHVKYENWNPNFILECQQGTQQRDNYKIDLLGPIMVAGLHLLKGNFLH